MKKTIITLVGTASLTGSAFGVIAVTLDTGASDTAAGSFVYNPGPAATNPAEVCVTAKIWDHSASAFVTGFLTPKTGVIAYTTTMDLDQGDYICTELTYKDSAGNPVLITPVTPLGGSQLATSFRVAEDGAVLGDDLVMVFEPGMSAGNTFNETHAAVGLPDQNNSTAQVTGSGLGSGFAGIDALTGAATTTYFTFAGVDSQQKAALRDNPGGGVGDTATDGFSWYAGNLGTTPIASGTEFRMTINGGIEPVPEPSAALLAALGMGAFLRRRRR